MYHEPVLLHESVDGLNIDPNGIYVDATYGGGGHARAIMDCLDNGRLIAFDQDADALDNRMDDDRLTLVGQNFRYLTNYLKQFDALPVAGLLADLGISSHQIDDPEKGFTFRTDSSLDMRMNQSQTLTAADVMATCEEEELVSILRNYGEIRDAGRIARAIIQSRELKPIRSSNDLIEALTGIVPEHKRHKYLARIFQALRIHVNDELGALRELLEQSKSVIGKGGRLVVISYHSLEDRLVKNFMRSGNMEGTIVKDLYGNYDAPFKPINRKVIIPSEEELERNPRSRSAKLRVAERL